MEIDLTKYLGKWFEIARIKNDFEPNMTNVTAQYDLIDDNTIQVINSGYVNNQFKQIVGTAMTTSDNSILKVSFFPCVYTEYKIMAIDKNYQYALIGGINKEHLWILGRQPIIYKTILNSFIEIAKKYNYNIDKLIISEFEEEKR